MRWLLFPISAIASLALFMMAPAYAAQDEQRGAQPSQEQPEDTPGSPFSDEPQTLLAEQMTPDQFIQFFTLFSASDEMASALDGAIARMLQSGKQIDDWQNQGIDILAELSARKGGLEANLLRDLDTEVLTITDLSGKVGPDLSKFDSYALRPEPVGLVAERGFASFVPGVWFETAMQRTQRGNALCYGGYFGITLHTSRPYTDWSERELIAIASMFSLLDRISALEFCAIYSVDEKGRFMTRGVLPDGRDLPQMNAESDASVIMPASQLDAFLKRQPGVTPAP